MAAVLALRLVAGFGLLAWLWLALLRGGFWRTGIRLPAAPVPTRWPSVAIVVPARDEAAILPLTMPTLLDQRYPGPLRVILVDDGSTDGTAELVARSWPAVAVVSPAPPPAGWAGKLWALRAGIDAATDVDLLLLTDADISHAPDSLARLVAVAEHRGLDLVSQMARLRCRTAWERLVVPAFVYFFALLYPMRWVNRVGARTAAAAGGCVLLRRDALVRAGGLAAIRGAVIDDVALAGAVKRGGGSVYLGLADSPEGGRGVADSPEGGRGAVASVRPYPSLASLWHMVARSAYAQLRHSPLLLAGTVVGLAAVFLGPPVSTVVGLFGDPVLAALGGSAWLVMVATYAPMLRYYGQPVLAALLLPVTATLYLAMTVDSARRHYLGRGAAWKGRTYSHRMPTT
jgi:hopene-associated glycosyltransferase HpnB